MKILKTAVSLAISIALAASVMLVAYAADVVVTVNSEINKAAMEVDGTTYAAKKLLVNTVTVPAGASIGAMILDFDYDETVYELIASTPDQEGRIITIVDGVAYYDDDVIPAGDPDFTLDISAETTPGTLIFAYVSTIVFPTDGAKQTLLTFILKAKDDADIASSEDVVTGTARAGSKDAGGANMGVTFEYTGGRIPGDANDSGTVTAVDATMVLRYVNWDVKPTINMSNSDVNESGTVTAADATLILRWVNWEVKPELK